MGFARRNNGITVYLFTCLSLTTIFVEAQFRQVSVTPQIEDDLNNGENSTRQEGSNRQRSQQEALFLLRRVNERFGALENSLAQQARKLDGFDYRLTKLEITAQENKDTLKSEFDHFQRKQETIEWELNKIATLLEVMRQDNIALQQNIVEIKVSQQSKKNTQDEDGHGQDDRTALSGNRIQALAASVYSLRNAVGSVQTNLELIVKNSTEAIDMIRKINNSTKNMITKQQLYFALEDFKSPTWLPDTMPPNTIPEHFELNPPILDCQSVYENGQTKSGIYRIKPLTSRRPFFVYCDMDYKDGGWTVIQNREDGGTDFFRTWKEYKHGFGNIGNEFWLGLQKLYMLTHQKVYTLCVTLRDFEGDRAEACYEGFAIGSESEGYNLQVLGAYEGEAGDSLLYHAGCKFSTKDVDNDDWEEGNCAEDHNGGWWYKGCDTSNLNGRYMNGPLPRSMEYQGIYWYEWHGPMYSLMSSRMMIRPVQFNITIQGDKKNVNITRNDIDK